MDDNEQGVSEHEEHEEWVEDRGDDDAPHPAESVEEESPREAIGYSDGIEQAIQSARKGPWLALSATKETPAPIASSAGVCAQCGRSYAIRMLKECPHCQAKRNRDNANELAKVIRELKAGRTNPEQERRLVKQLHHLGHPHVAEFLASLEARNQAAVTKPRSRL